MNLHQYVCITYHGPRPTTVLQQIVGSVISHCRQHPKRPAFPWLSAQCCMSYIAVPGPLTSSTYPTLAEVLVRSFNPLLTTSVTCNAVLPLLDEKGCTNPTGETECSYMHLCRVSREDSMSCMKDQLYGNSTCT